MEGKYDMPFRTQADPLNAVSILQKVKIEQKKRKKKSVK